MVLDLSSVNSLARDEVSIRVWIPGWSFHHSFGPMSSQKVSREVSRVATITEGSGGLAAILNEGLASKQVDAAQIDVAEVDSFDGRAGIDYKILRVLAVGSLYLDAVPFCRASSRFLSPYGMQYAVTCGANEFGFGAYGTGLVHPENSSQSVSSKSEDELLSHLLMEEKRGSEH